LLGALDQGKQKLLNSLAQLVEALVLVLFAEFAFLIFPMGGNALLGNAVHFLGPDLDLEGLAAITDNRRMQRLVQIVPRDRYPVLKTLGNRGPDVVDNAHRQIAVLSIVFSDYAGGDQIVYLFYAQLLFGEFFPE